MGWFPEDENWSPVSAGSQLLAALLLGIAAIVGLIVLQVVTYFWITS